MLRKNFMQFNELPWTDVVIDTRDFVVFKDGYPVTEGHVLFVPKVEDWEHLAKCYKAAYGWGYDWVQNGYCDSFNIGQNVGKEAGQTVEWPHVHLIPRRKGDMEDPRGGVRHVIPHMGNYEKLSRGFNEYATESLEGC
jgi:diadenosine tetraphosphate (Ap4A) HIT family hydrolase